MPTTMMIIPVETVIEEIDGEGIERGTGVPIIPLEDGEQLAYSVGFVDTWRDYTAIEDDDPETDTDEGGNPLDPKWTKQNKVNNGWITHKPYLENDVNVGEIVTRRYSENVEAFKGGWTAVTPLPANVPINTVIIWVTTTEELLNTIHGRLFSIDARCGLAAEITLDA